MVFKREQSQVLATIKRSGNSQICTIQTTKTDPMGGGSLIGKTLTTYFTQVSYNGVDIADPNLAQGLLKIIIPAIDDSGELLESFKEIVTDKSAKLVYQNGTSLGVITAKITIPDGVTPIMARLYIGG